MADGIVDFPTSPPSDQRRIHPAEIVFRRILTALPGVAHGGHHCLGAPLQPGRHGLDLGCALLHRYGLPGLRTSSATTATTPVHRPSRLDGGVGQRVGLFRDAADDPEDGADRCTSCCMASMERAVASTSVTRAVTLAMA